MTPHKLFFLFFLPFLLKKERKVKGLEELHIEED